jgi:sugar phosphate isomerase/epimerase
MANIQLCLFASTPDMAGLGFIVKVHMGLPEDLCRKAVEWGYDGIEFMPDPDRILDPATMRHALAATGSVLPVVNSGRMAVQGYALLAADPELRRRSIQAYQRLLDFAGCFGARTGLGAARGACPSGLQPAEAEKLAGDVFLELAEHARKAGSVVMLEPADPGVTSYIHTMDEAMTWVDRLAHPAFSVMMDTYQLAESEPSIEHGIRAARGTATHIHLYDPSRWPPGVRAQSDRLDWPLIMRLLREEGFAGSASVVVAPEGDPEPAARKTAAFLRGLFRGGEEKP